MEFFEIKFDESLVAAKAKTVKSVAKDTRFIHGIGDLMCQGK